MENKYIGLDDIEKINNQNEVNKKNKKNKKNKRKIVFFWEKLSIKENIIIFSFILIFFIIINGVIRYYESYNIIDYSKIEFLEFIDENEINREIFWNSNEIVSMLIYSSNSETSKYCDREKYPKDYLKHTIDEYYDTLYDDYKKIMSKKKYDEIMNKIISNYYKDNDYNLNEFSNSVIESVYKINSDKVPSNSYLVKIKSDIPSYIGITMNEESSTFKIFWIYYEEEQ